MVSLRSTQGRASVLAIARESLTLGLLTDSCFIAPWPILRISEILVPYLLRLVPPSRVRKTHSHVAVELMAVEASNEVVVFIVEEDLRQRERRETLAQMMA